MTVVYVITIIVAVIIALLLAYLASMSGKPKAAPEGASGGSLEYTGVRSQISRDLKRVVYNEISEVVGSSQQSKQLAESMSEIFHRELEKEVTQNIAQISAKYERTIKEKGESEEIAWKKYQKTLDDKKKTDAVIRSITEGLVVVDASGKVVMMNPAAEKLLNVSKNDKIGRPISDDVKDTQLLSMIKPGGSGKDRSVELVSQRDDTRKVLRASSAVIEDENGETVGMVSVLNDITKQKDLDQMKSGFVANVSHELRTPLVAIEKSIALIMNGTAGAVPEQQKQLLELAGRNIQRLNVLINDLLELSKLESGKVILKSEYGTIGKVIDEAAAGLASWANAKSLKLEKHVADGLPQAFMDQDKIIQVLTNLIGNSIKFTPAGGIIDIRARMNDNNSKEILVSVRDTGIGIAKENLSKVFEKFYQTGERISTDISGTGIGLSIVKEIVEMHRGRVWAESEKGKWTEFIFTLPAQPGR